MGQSQDDLQYSQGMILKFRKDNTSLKDRLDNKRSKISEYSQQIEGVKQQIRQQQSTTRHNTSTDEKRVEGQMLHRFKHLLDNFENKLTMYN